MYARSRRRDAPYQPFTGITISTQAEADSLLPWYISDPSSRRGIQIRP